MTDPAFQLDLEGFQCVLAAMPDFVLVLDTDGVLRYINRLEEGYEMESVVGTRSRELLRPETRDAHDAALAAALRNGTSEEYEAGVVTPAGAEEWYRSRIFPLEKEGRTVAMVLVGTNVTELKVAQRELARIRQLLPICSWCDRIQRPDGEWESIEAHLKREQGTTVSHGLCPTCLQNQVEGLSSDGGAA